MITCGIRAEVEETTCSASASAPTGSSPPAAAPPVVSSAAAAALTDEGRSRRTTLSRRPCRRDGLTYALKSPRVWNCGCGENMHAMSLGLTLE